MLTRRSSDLPASDTDCGLPGASSVMVTVAVRAPVAAGVKLMLSVQLAPGATEPASVEIGRASWRETEGIEAVRALLVMQSVACPLWVRVTVCKGHGVLRCCKQKARLVSAQVLA